MLVPELLLETLDELLEDDFHKLKWFLSLEVMAGCSPIPRRCLQTSTRMDTVSRMMESYGAEMAVNITAEILKRMRSINAAETLEKRYQEGKTAAPSGTRTSAVAPPAAPLAPPAAPLAPPAALATLFAQQGGVIFAPTVSGSSSGMWNINIQK